MGPGSDSLNYPMSLLGAGGPRRKRLQEGLTGLARKGAKRGCACSDEASGEGLWSFLLCSANGSPSVAARVRA